MAKAAVRLGERQHAAGDRGATSGRPSSETTGTRSGVSLIQITPGAALGIAIASLLILISGHGTGVFFELAVFASMVNIFALVGVLLWARMSYQAKIEEAAQKQTIALLLNDFHDQAEDWLWETDVKGRVRNPSHRFSEIAHAVGLDLEGSQLSALFVEESETLGLAGLLSRQAAFRDVVVKVKSDAHHRYWRVSGRPLYDSERRFLGYRGVASDVTEKVLATDRLSYLAHHDTLTGLANRQRLLESVHEAIANASEAVGSALFVLDLDQFKGVNDTMGHQVGDELLAAVANRLRQRLRPDAVVARLGGDEFAILSKAEPRSDWAADTANRLLNVFAEPFSVGGVSIAVRTSIGVATIEASNRARDALDLLRRADLALYRAKAEGCGFKSYETTMNDRAVRQHTLRQALATAIDNQELHVLYQPLLDRNTRYICGFEALLRWTSETCGSVPPDEFIPIAEESGLMIQIGDWVLEAAIREAVQWPSSVRIAVNLSPVQFRDDELLAKIEGLVDRIGIDPRRLELEITESTLLDATRDIKETLHRIADLGVGIVLDDFGTGYSSLSYLQEFPFSKIKIDRGFVSTVTAEERSQAIIRAVVDIGHAFGMKVVAEGVEYLPQYQCLETLGCDQLQGFVLSEPLAPESTRNLLKPRRERGQQLESPLQIDLPVPWSQESASP